MPHWNNPVAEIEKLTPMHTVVLYMNQVIHDNLIETNEQRKCFVMVISLRYKHRSYDGAKTWIEPAAGTNVHTFNEVHIRGSAQLAVMPLNGLRALVHFHADRLYGDKSGFLHVGYNQNFSVAVTDPDIPFGLRVYENGSMMLPRRAFLQTVSFKSSGKVCIRQRRGQSSLKNECIFYHRILYSHLLCLSLSKLSQN